MAGSLQKKKPTETGTEILRSKMHKVFSSYLEAFGFASVVAKLKRPALKQLLMWKLVEEAFVLHHTTTPAPASYKRSTKLSAPWGAPAAAAMG